jgi:RecG-like helicase
MALRRKSKNQADNDSNEPVAVSIADMQARQYVCVSGKVTRMTARPTSGQPALAVRISDESGTVTAVWTGRRSIGGITLGRRIAIKGIAVGRGTKLEFTNPSYTLLNR